MMKTPKIVTLLSLAGLIPFVFGAATLIEPTIWAWGEATLGARFVGTQVQLTFGIIIVGFMSGALWGFNARCRGLQQGVGYILCVVPVLWVLFAVDDGSEDAITNLMVGFGVLLILDWYYWHQDLAPVWWLRLRIWVTALVLASLSVSLYA